MLEKKLVIGIHGGGGTGDGFKEAIGECLKSLGYEYSFPNFNGNGTKEEIIDSLLTKNYDDYKKQLKKEINQGVQERYTDIALLSHSWGASIAFNYMLREKEIPPQLKKVVCVAPLVNYLKLNNFKLLPKFLQNSGILVNNFLYRLSLTSKLKRKRLKFLGIKNIRSSTILSYFHHAFLIDTKDKELPLQTELYFPEKDDVLDRDGQESNRKYHEKLLFRWIDKESDSSLIFKTYESKTHNGWEFDKIFPKGLF